MCAPKRSRVEGLPERKGWGIEAHAGKLGDISIYGQESNYTAWRLVKMNLAIRRIDGKIAQGDSFHNDRHPNLKADYLLVNVPFRALAERNELGAGPMDTEISILPNESQSVAEDAGICLQEGMDDLSSTITA